MTLAVLATAYFFVPETTKNRKIISTMVQSYFTNFSCGGSVRRWSHNQFDGAEPIEKGSLSVFVLTYWREAFHTTQSEIVTKNNKKFLSATHYTYFQ